MKKILLALCFVAGTTITSFAQLGKMQYEDAEEQYAAGKYEEAIELLDDAEMSVKKTNPMISHLRIMSKAALLKSGYTGYMRNSHIKDAKMEAEIFLKEHEGNAQLEDKYRDVYRALKELKGYKLPELAPPAQTIDEIIAEHIKTMQIFLHKYKDGMTLSEIRQIIPGEYNDRHKDFVTVKLINTSISLSFSSSGKSMGYHITFNIPEENKPSCDDFKNLLSKLRPLMQSALGSATKHHEKDQYILDTWEKGQKNITISLSCSFAYGSLHQYVMSDSHNKAIK